MRHHLLRHITHESRFILHIDMDAFYASIEQRDQPALRGRAVIVGGSPDKRGVVVRCSYEASQFDIHSVLASRTAFRLCLPAVFLPARFEVSARIIKLFRTSTDLVQPLSLITGGRCDASAGTGFAVYPTYGALLCSLAHGTRVCGSLREAGGPHHHFVAVELKLP
jgi:impB/mucB/samB family